MDQLEERMTRIEAVISQLDKRLTEWINHFDTELRGLRASVEGRFNSLGSRINQLFYAMITSWVTIIAAVIASLLVAIFK